jgi:hypothetical protein
VHSSGGELRHRVETFPVQTSGESWKRNSPRFIRRATPAACRNRDSGLSAGAKGWVRYEGLGVVSLGAMGTLFNSTGAGRGWYGPMMSPVSVVKVRVTARGRWYCSWKRRILDWYVYRFSCLRARTSTCWKLSMTDSWFTKTGQHWKLRVFVVLTAILVTTAWPGRSVLLSVGVSEQPVEWVFRASALLMICWAAAGVSCPQCGRWLGLWHMRNKSVMSWITDFLSMRACPVCGYVPGESATGKATEGDAQRPQEMR